MQKYSNSLADNILGDFRNMHIIGHNPTFTHQQAEYERLKNLTNRICIVKIEFITL